MTKLITFCDSWNFVFELTELVVALNCGRTNSNLSSSNDFNHISLIFIFGKFRKIILDIKQGDI